MAREAYSDEVIAVNYLRKIEACKGKYEFSLTFAEYKRLWKAKRCYYTGTLLPLRGVTWTGSDKYDRPTIDRVDNSLGYVTGNVVACTYSFNQLKAIYENSLNSVTQKSILSAFKKLDRRSNDK